MTLFDLLFLVAALTTIVTLAVAAFRAVRGRVGPALRLMRTWVICAAVYLATGLALSAFAKPRVFAIGEPWCFDDWCLTARATARIPTAQGTRVAVDLVIGSRAKRVTQRARGAWIYVVDSAGHRYGPEPDPTATPLDVQLQPGDTVPTTRIFDLPAGASAVGLITGHGGPYCGVMNILVIGDAGCVFGKPAMIKLD